MKTAFAAILGLLLIAGPASAVVIVSGTGTGALDTTGLSAGFTYDLQGGGNTLVFGTYVDNNYTASNILFDGAAPSGTIQNGRSFLAYYYNPDSSVNISFDTSAGNANGGYFLYELNYVDTTLAADLGTDASITTTSADRFVVDYMGINFADGAGSTPAVGSIISSSTITNFNGAIGGGALASGTGFAGAAGVQTLGWTLNGSGTGEISAAFAPAAGGPTPWNVNGGGSFNVGANWVGGNVPVSNPFFGAAHATNTTANITLDSPVSVSSMTISNSNRYNLTGPSALTLTGAAEILVGEGTHEISAVIAGSAGLTKSGGGNLALTGANTYAGTTNVQGGSLQLPAPGSVNGAVNVAAAGQLNFTAGYNGAFSGDISGDGNVLLDASRTTEIVTFSGAKTFAGTIDVNGGTLAISNSSALGAGDGTPATQTRVNEFGGQGTGKLALSGNINVANELLILGPRRGEGVADLVHLTSAGNNTWGGNIKGDANGDNYNFESTSGTLTLSGTMSAPDGNDGVRNFVFSGAGNFNVTGKIIDFETNDNGVKDVASLDTQVNVYVNKQGSGTLTIRTATAQEDDFWRGGTVVEGGTLEVISNGANAGELWGPIEVRSGATLDVDHFGTYSLQVGQSLSGGGTIQATGKTVAIFDDNSISPGDGVGTLTINGNATLSDVGGGGGVLSFELGNDPNTVGGTENDLIQINGSLSTSGAPNMTVSVTAAEGQVTAGKYRLISHAGGAVNVTGLTAQFLDELGNPLTARQTLGVSSAAGQVNLDVTGSSKSLTWTGANSMAWDKNTTANWNDGSGADVFYDVDQVTFNDSAGANTTVDISGADVYPSLAAFDSATGNTYTITGSNGFGGTTPINLTGDVTVALQNTNNLQGNVNIGADATLELGGGSVVSGNIAGAGSLVINGGATLASANSLTGPITISSQVFPQNGGALGAAAAGTTLLPGANLWYNFQNLAVAEPFTFAGGQINVAGNADSALALSGLITVDAAGGTILVNGGLGDDGLSISNNITGAADGALTANVGPDSLMTVTGNITNNGSLTKFGSGTLALGAATVVTSPELVVNGGSLDVTAQAALPLGSGQTLSGSFGTVTGNVNALSGSTVRVGQTGLPSGTIYTYTDANWTAGGNTVVASDDSTPTVAANNTQPSALWSPRTPFANGGSVLQGRLDANADQAPTLKTTISGLTPNQEYEVLVDYWNDGSGWHILAGDSAGSLTLFDPGNSIVTTGLTYGSAVLTTEGNRTMWGAPLTLTANGSGEIEVFIDEMSATPNPRTWYDGVSIAAETVIGQTFTIDGDLTLNSGSTLALDIATPAASDLLTITGSFAAGGALDVTLDAAAPAPSLGDVFTILDFASASGAFNSLVLPALGAGLGWDTSSLLTTGELSVVEFAGLPGDFNNDTKVNGADFLAWQRGYPATYDAADLADWQSNYGTTASFATSGAVPEPTGLALAACLAALAAAGLRRGR
ncbi:MAG: autotransporter-associated beta strand repeat-containing protein [Planctomycetales bacterium]|nr:autotransporter-associated beta strand repeat-containing protein [Planctomycetales bacterium]